ncbi:MAG: carbonic anhydrase family protein [Gammaproteobacteria bacterium]|nr:carbonic anhydrase family protein [Gammaproteobacteria bacterium]
MTDDPTAEEPTHEQVAWGYDAESGPAVWGCLSTDYALCALGKHQSPINLVDPTPAAVAALAFNYRPTMLSIENNGHTVEVRSTNDNWIEVGDDSYELVQFHFHTPGEHTVAGQRFDMEIHLVHRNEAEELAVVGILVRRGNSHPLLELVAEHIPGRGQVRTLQHTMINAADLLPTERRSFRYEGSLTTPPCSEGVRWFVLETPIEASAAELAAFEAALGTNNRPVQALNGRKLLIEQESVPRG